MFRGRRFLMTALAVVAVTIGSFAFAADVLTQFQLTEEDARLSVFDSFWRGTPVDFGGAPSIFRTLSPEARATAVTAAAVFVRAYGDSDAFREHYAARRRAERPPDVPPTTARTDIDKQIAEQNKAMAEARAAMASMPPEMRKMAEEAMKAAGATGDMDAQMAQLQEQGTTAMKAQKAGQAKAEAQMAELRTNAKLFDATYPANPERFLAARLREFVALSDTVPAQAQLVRRSGKMVFADPALESKPEYWKQLYRAGKPSVDAARAAATAWLATLEKGATP